MWTVVRQGRASPKNKVGKSRKVESKPQNKSAIVPQKKNIK